MTTTTASKFPNSGKLIEQIADSLDKQEAQMRTKLPESVFKAHFLKFFAGLEVDPNPTAENSKPALWIGIAGNPFASVDVVDDQTREILYTVPPLFDMDAVGVSDRRHGSFHYMISRMAEYAAIHPNQGRKYFADYINKLEILHDRREEAIRQTVIWMNIFKRYNIVPIDFQLDPTAPIPKDSKIPEIPVNSSSQVVYTDDDML